MPANNSSSTASLSRTVLAGIACGLLTFLVDVPRLDPTFFDCGSELLERYSVNSVANGSGDDCLHH